MSEIKSALKTWISIIIPAIYSSSGIGPNNTLLHTTVLTGCDSIRWSDDTHTHTKRWILDYRIECINWTPSDIQKKISSIFPETKVTSCPFFFVLEELSLLMLCATVYIYTRQLISFRAPMLSFIKLTVATCHMQFKPFWDYVSLFYKKMDKIGKYLKSTIFLWYKNGRERAEETFKPWSTVEKLYWSLHTVYTYRICCLFEPLECCLVVLFYHCTSFWVHLKVQHRISSTTEGFFVS